MQEDQQAGTLGDFSMLSLIGVGNYAKVILVRRRTNGKVYAMKIVKKRKGQGELKGVKKEHAYIEKEILTHCLHPFIIRLHCTFQKHRKLYYVLDYCPGGELFGLIRRRKRFSEEATKFYAAQLVLALEFLHSKHYVYRDLKPENVLIDHKGYLKLVDFGLSCSLDQLHKADPIAGTPEYLPPEIFQKGVSVTPSVDWWALGNLIFEMIAGFPPFFVQQQKYETIKGRICQGDPPLYYVSNPLLKDLLGKLLDKNPSTRFGSKGASEVREHAWFYGTNWDGLLLQNLVPPFKPQISNQTDTHLFQQEQKEMSPPESNASDQSNTQKYFQFSSSWRSSRGMGSTELIDGSPPEIVINIREKYQN